MAPHPSQSLPSGPLTRNVPYCLLIYCYVLPTALNRGFEQGVDFEARTIPEVPEEKHGNLSRESTLRPGYEAGISCVYVCKCVEGYRYINWLGMPCMEICGKAIFFLYPRYRPTWPRGVQEVKAPRFLDTRHMKLVISSPLRTGRLYPQEYPGTHF